MRLFLRICSCCIFLFFSSASFSENHFNSFVFLKAFDEKMQKSPPETILVLFSDATSSSLSNEQKSTLALLSSFTTSDKAKLHIIHENTEAQEQIISSFEKTDFFYLQNKNSFFSHLPEKIDLLYLACNPKDNMDSLELELLQLEDAEQLYPSLHDDSLIVIDCARESEGSFITKSIYPSLDYFLNQGWNKIYEGNYFLLEKKK